MDDIVLYLQVVEDELGRVRCVGVNSADFCGGEEDILGPFVCKELLNFMLILQLKLGMRPADDIGEPFRLQCAHDRGADQAFMTGDVYF